MSTIAKKRGKPKPKPRKRMRFSELQRLAVCNSSKLPQQIEIIEELEVRPKGRRKWTTKKVSHFKEWVGIGWVDIEPHQANKNPMLVVNDDGSYVRR